MAGETKIPILVLCHTILHNAFRTGEYNTKMDMKVFKKWLQSKFIGWSDGL